MTEYLLLAHWMTTGFLLLMCCVEVFAHRWTGYRFVYGLYAGLPLLVCFTFFLQTNASSIHLPEVMASLSVRNNVPVAVSSHVNTLQWVWFVGAAIFLAGLVRQWMTLNRLSGEKIPLGSMEALISKEVSSPCLKGIFRPVILLPSNYQEKFTENQLALIVAHEKVHARRMDNLWNIVALGMRAVFWFNPFVWFAYHRFRLLQELSCDEAVLAGQPPAVPLAYAKALLTASEFPLAKQPLCTHYGDKKMMLKRMNCIKSAGLISRGAQWLALCVMLAVSGSISAIAATGAPSEGTDPMRKTTVPPKYPSTAMEAKEEAELILEFNVDANDGHPFDIRVVDNTAKEEYRAGFDKAAIDSVKQWRYEPSGRVRYNVRAKISFKLAR
ncbi:M56 family metallopeptidase [Microbulbifer hainanensis]|uniref:M56 family metallopeptidase n=1 Tax=Microbulbifer hainanensis TaxID=2735675 RepID=UPI001865A8A7|nr:M56 family metallopeptidase [Microbulbifer hainanensis]